MLSLTPSQLNQDSVVRLTLVLTHHVNANTSVTFINQVENHGNTIALFTTVSEKTVSALSTLNKSPAQVHQLATLLLKFFARPKEGATIVSLVNQKSVLILASLMLVLSSWKKLNVTLLRVKLNKLKDHTQKTHAVTSTNAPAHQYHNVAKLVTPQLVPAQPITLAKSAKLNSSKTDVAKPGPANATLLKSLNDALKEVKSTKSTNTSGKTHLKDARGANVKKSSLTVKLKPFLDVMLDKRVKNFLKLHQLVFLTDTAATIKCHNVLFTETSHGNVVPDESGLAIKKLRDVVKLALSHQNAHLVHELHSQNADQPKILSKSFTFQTQT
jgi:hypothetical protein